MCRHFQQIACFFSVNEQDKLGKERGRVAKCLWIQQKRKDVMNKLLIPPTHVLNGRDGVGDKRVGVYVYMNGNIERLLVFGYKDCY